MVGFKHFLCLCSVPSCMGSWFHLTHVLMGWKAPNLAFDNPIWQWKITGYLHKESRNEDASGTMWDISFRKFGVKPWKLNSCSNGHWAIASEFHSWEFHLCFQEPDIWLLNCAEFLGFGRITTSTTSTTTTTTTTPTTTTITATTTIIATTATATTSTAATTATTTAATATATCCSVGDASQVSSALSIY